MLDRERVAAHPAGSGGGGGGSPRPPGGRSVRPPSLPSLLPSLPPPRWARPGPRHRLRAARGSCALRRGPPCPRPLLRARLAGPCPCLTRGVLDGAGRGNTSRLSKTSTSGLLHLLCTLCCFRPSLSISPHELEGRDSPHYSPRFLMKHSSSLQSTSCRCP